MKLLSKNKVLTSLTTLTFLLLLSGCGAKPQSYKISLEVWGPMDDPGVFSSIIEEYHKINTFIEGIEYRKFSVDTYKSELLEAMILGQGPDIFLIQNSWLPYFKDKIEPAPAAIFSEKQLRDSFVDVVAFDFLADGKVYGSPLSVDSLALYYNKDLLNAEGIIAPPKTWKEFQEDVKKIAKMDNFGNITQAGASLGTAYNVNRSTDILMLLAMQKGAQSTANEKGGFDFTRGVTLQNETYNPGDAAFDFYVDFSRLTSPYYTWNRIMHNSIDSFSEGKTAMMLNYSWQYDSILVKNPKLNFGVANVPQFADMPPANYANYWSFVVNKNKINPNSTSPQTANKARIHEAWEFLKFLTLKNPGKITFINALSGGSKEFPVSIDPAKEYLKATRKPAARRDILEEQTGDVFLAPFAYGNMIAKSWYQEDSEAIEKILSEAIDSYNLGKSSVSEAIQIAMGRIGNLEK